MDASRVQLDTASLSPGRHLVQAEVSAGTETSMTLISTALLWRLRVLRAEDQPEATALPFASNSPPVLQSVSPLSDVTLEEGKSTHFTVIAADANAWDRLEFSWFVDGKRTGKNEPTFELRSAAFGPGLHSVKLLVFDIHASSAAGPPIPAEAGSLRNLPASRATSHEWSINVVGSLDALWPGSIDRVMPRANPIIRSGSALPFQAVASDAGAHFRWKLDGITVPQSEASLFVYEPTEDELGVHSISVELLGKETGEPSDQEGTASPEALGSGTGFAWVVEVVDSQDSGIDFPPDPLTERIPSANAIVMDTTSPGTRAEGNWLPSAGVNAYGPNSLFGKDGATFTFEPAAAVQGEYAIFLWWSYLESRSSEVPVDIRHARGTTRVKVNQLQKGGRWNYIGTYSLGKTPGVTLTADGPLSTCADAVAFDPVGGKLDPGPVVIVDNGEAGTTREGTWKTSSGFFPFGEDSLYATGSGAYTYSPKLAAGRYRVYLWWTAFSSRSTRVPVTVQTTARRIDVEVNQRMNGGQWNLIGSFDLDPSSRVQLQVTDSSTVCADAAKFELMAPPPGGSDPAPSTPAGLLASAQAGVFNLDWSDNLEPDFASYSIYRSSTPGANYKLIASGITASRYTDENVSGAINYYYVVTANDTSGNESARSTEASPRTLGSATLAWDPVTRNADGTPITDLRGYKVFYGSQSRKYSVVIDAGTRTQHTVSPLEPGTYYFAVKAVDTHGNESKLSAEVKKTIP
jgi:hypothetical protein